jgi:hypothetical protein
MLMPNYCTSATISTMPKVQAAGPFDDLTGMPRKITPKNLTGEKKKLWEELVRRWKRGELAGLPQSEIHAWAVRHLGLTCTRYCTRSCLISDAEKLSNGCKRNGVPVPEAAAKQRSSGG